MYDTDAFLRPPESEIRSVTAITRQIKAMLENGFAQQWVRGEVSNLRRQSSGHVYFSLKDKDAQLSCVLFSNDARRQSFELENGMDLLLFGNLSVYPPRGGYQLIGRIALQSGLGKLQAQFEALKRELAAEGLFDPAKRRALPHPARTVAVITSPTGAALRDFLRILVRRGYRGHVTLYPARVQGTGASEEIRAMLARAQASGRHDLIVLTRGGGSIEDLWAFNETPLVRAVAASRIPVISAIGHEIDHVLTDFAADLRSETPSGAAEHISSAYLERCTEVQRLHDQFEAARGLATDLIRLRLDRVGKALGAIAPVRQLQFLNIKLDEIELRSRAGWQRALSARRDRLSGLDRRLQSLNPTARCRLQRQHLLALSHRLQRTVNQQVTTATVHAQQLSTRLHNSSLPAALKRGFVIVKDPQNRLISSSKGLRQNDRATLHFRDGTADVIVAKPGQAD